MFAVALTIQLPQVQTFVTDKVASSLSERFDGDIRIEKVHFKPFTTLILRNVSITDRNPVSDPQNPDLEPADTLFRARYIIARFTLEGLFEHEGILLNKLFVEDGLMNLVIEDKADNGDGDTATDNLSRIFRIGKPEAQEENDKELFHIRKVEISNMRFTMRSCQAERLQFSQGGIDWNDMDIRNININARELMFKGGIMSGTAEKISFREKTGYVVESISGSAKVGRGKTIIENFQIHDLWSDLYLTYFMLSYKNVLAFQDFINDVKIDAELTESHLDFKTLSYFAPELKGNALKADISGNMSGYIDGFNFNNFSFLSDAGGFSGTASGNITGLPDIETAVLDVDLKNFNITSRGLTDFLAEWTSEESKPDLSGYAPGVEFNINAIGSGTLNDLDLKTDIVSSSGSINADINLSDLLSQENAIGIAGKVRTKDLNIGKMIGVKLLGPTTLGTGFNARIGMNGNPSEVKIDTMKVDRLHANGYDYSNITASGTIASDSFNGGIVANDPNFNFIFQGIFALSAKTQNAKYQFFTNIGYADLYALNLDKRGTSKLSLRANADFTKANTGDIKGRVEIDDLNMENSLGRHDIGKIALNSYSSGNTNVIRMNSRFATGNYTGSAPVTEFVKDLVSITMKKELPSLFEDPSYTWSGNNYSVNFKFSNSSDLLTFVLPGLYIEEGTSITASINRKGRFTANLKSNRLAYRKNYLKNIKSTFDNSNDALSVKMSSEEIKLASISVKDNHLTLHGEDDKIGLRFDYDNHSELANNGEIILNGLLSRDEDGAGIDLNILPSSVYINNKKWQITDSRIAAKSKEFDVRSFSLLSGDEEIFLNGKISKENVDTLNMNLNRFDISLFNEAIGKDVGVKGIATGIVQLTSPMKEKGLLIDMICDSTYIASAPLGVVTVGSRWNETDQNFDVFIRNELENRNNLNIYGTFAPRNNHIDAIAQLDSMRVDYLQPLLTDVFSTLNGRVSGSLDISGPPSRLKIKSSDTRLDEGLFRIAYTNVPYHINGPFHIDHTGVYFDDISIKDDYTGTGSLTGSINWDHFKNMRFNTHISINEIEGINLDEEQSEDFYGRVFGTGNIHITGPMNSILLNVDAVTAKDGRLNIPLDNAATAGKVTNILSFKEEETFVRIDPYEAMMIQIDESEKSAEEFTVNLKLNAQPEVEVYVELDKASGNVISARGNGLIDLVVRDEDFSINGDYIISSGNCKFAAMGLVSRDFQIEDGSTIHFNGDIMDSDLNINAVYKTKASLSTLLADEASVANNRTVNCKVSITEKLSNPQIGLDIEVPDLNPMIKSRVESALSTEDKIQKQFIWLLVSGSFLPDEESGVVNNTTALYSNAASELIANQLNNIFEKLDIPLDLGLNYQTNETGNDLFDVAVSTQLFNNRVVVNGNIGNKQYTTSGSQNDVVGDLDIEIKLNRAGAFRALLFSHSADQLSNYLDNSQRNGVGIMYQTEFNSLKTFFRNMFAKKAKRKEAKLKEEQDMLQSEKVEISIKRPENTANDNPEENGRKQR